MSDLFTPVSRTERQHMCERAWIKNKGIGSLVLPTGFGKTRCATDIIQALTKKYPNISVIVVVPTLNLQDQWIEKLDILGLSLNCQVIVINTASKNIYKCDLLIIDEAHRAAAEGLSHVFKTITYKLLLCLTATMERLDERHHIITSKAPIVDTVSTIEALANKWVSDYKEYQILIDVDDIDTFTSLTKEFNKYFEFFNWDFKRVTKMCGKDGYKEQLIFRDELCPHGTREEKSNTLRAIKLNCAQLMRVTQARKAFINNHPEKIRIARKIIEARPEAKIITFSNNIKMAESIGMGGVVYTGKDSKKKGRANMEDFKSGNFTVLHTVKKVDEGADIPGVSVAIIIGLDSSKIKATQRRGRAIRKEGDKIAEIFNVIINNTTETKWFAESHKGVEYITIDEQGLDDVLCGKTPKPYKKKSLNFKFRF